MTAAEIARRADARESGRGWIARCPAHSDRSPSLSIREGRDGRVLVRCFAGCEPSGIVGALGLQVRDLFGDSSPPSSRFGWTNRVVGADAIEQSLQAELGRIKATESERAGFEVAELTRHRNTAREIIERRYAVSLMRETSPWWEIAPHALDPVWSGCVDQAVSVAAARRGISRETLRGAIEDLPQTQERVLVYARNLQRSLTKELASRRQCAV